MPIENLQVTATGLPEGVTVDSATGALSGTPVIGSGAFGEGGQTTYTASITATATGLESVTKNVSIIVKKTRYEIRDSSNAKIGSVSLSDLQAKIRDNSVLFDYPIGSELIVPVHNLYGQESMIYECPFRLGTVREFELQDGTKFTGLGLVSKYGLPATGVQFDAPEPSNSNSDRKAKGNNRWMYSALRQWMNKTGTNWWESQHSADASPTAEWVASHGLLDCFPASFIDAIQPVKAVTQTHSVDGGGLDTTYDKFFCLSANEVFSGQVADEGSQWECYKSGSKVYYSINDISSHVNVWLRSTSFGSSSYGMSYVNPVGAHSYTTARSVYHACTACVL